MRRRITWSDFRGTLFPNRKSRKASMMKARFALTVFADNAPFHRMIAKSASIETMVKALGCAMSVGEEKKQERK